MTYCSDSCFKKYYPDAAKQLFYWDKKGFKKCRPCGIIVDANKYPELRCKCCKNRFSFRILNKGQRRYDNEKMRPRVDYSKINCVICGKQVGLNMHRVYRFDRTNPDLRHWYICDLCYNKRRYKQKKIDKLKILVPNK